MLCLGVSQCGLISPVTSPANRENYAGGVSLKCGALGSFKLTAVSSRGSRHTAGSHCRKSAPVHGQKIQITKRIEPNLGQILSSGANLVPSPAVIHNRQIAGGQVPKNKKIAFEPNNLLKANECASHQSQEPRDLLEPLTGAFNASNAIPKNPHRSINPTDNPHQGPHH